MKANLAPVFGRCMIALVFVLSAIMKIVGFSHTAAQMAEKNLPMVEVLLVVSIIIELTAALMIMLGWRARLGALALLLWMIPVTVLYHNFWTMVDMEQFINRIMFLKNISLMGAMLYIISYGSGRYSLDNLHRSPVPQGKASKI